MLQYNIEFTKNANDDALQIKEYIAKDNQLYANKVIETIFGLIHGMLSFFPNIGTSISENNRMIVEKTFKYRIFYKIKGDTIYIMEISKNKDTKNLSQNIN